MFEGMNPLDSVLFVSVVVGFWAITSWAAWTIAAASAWLALHFDRLAAAGMAGLVGTVGIVSASNGFASHPLLMAVAVVPIGLVFAAQLLIFRFILSRLPTLMLKTSDDA